LISRSSIPGFLSLAIVGVSLGAPVARAVTLDFRTGGSSQAASSGSGYGNGWTFNQAGTHVAVTGWGNTGTSGFGPVFEKGYVGRFSTGLGVCNRDEGSISKCIQGGLLHQVDNSGQQDLVLFRFDGPAVLQAITIDPYGEWDRDVSYWVGNLAPGVDLTGHNFSDLGTLGFGGQLNSLNSVGEGPLTINLGNVIGNALLFGAHYPINGSVDRFKIRSLTAAAAPVVPVPGALGLFLSGLAALAGARRFRSPAHP
jgi:hypothetical protein